jgi:hypothetical protein
MKHLLKMAFAVAVASVAISAQAQTSFTVQFNGLGSSALFLQMGLAASSSSGTIKANCIWSENTGSVAATDASVSPSTVDSGNAWVAWNVGNSTGTCATPVADATHPVNIYAYLQADSTVGNRCLFNGSNCTIAYPTTPAAGPGPNNLILTGSTCGSTGECNLPNTVAQAINTAAVNAAGTDIRPEDAEFATKRALKSTANCGSAIGGTQYLGLGYPNGGTIISAFSSTSKFNVVDFSLPSSFSVTPVGAVPVVVVVHGNGSSSGFSNSSITNLTSQALANFLDGRYSYTQQARSTPSASGNAATVIIREPLSGTYNTMEYNVPNTTVLKTSQDVGQNQLTAQKNCNATGDPLSNPMNISTASGGARKRAIGTGQELAQVIANSDSLGYSFWSVNNFKGFNGVSNAKYLTVDLKDPLLTTGVPYSTYNGAIPVLGSSEMQDVDLSTTVDGSYPIWSMLRLVNTGGSASAAVTALAQSAGLYISFGGTNSRPDFVTPASLTVVRSHFIPPAGSIYPATAYNGHDGSSHSSVCVEPDKGGDVGGVVYTLTADSSYCTSHSVTTGQTGQRR